MTWREWNAARYLIAEEFLGKYLRASQNAESARYAKSVAALKRYEPQE